MKWTVLILVATFAINGLNAQVPAWQWSESAGTGRDDIGLAIANSTNGSVVITGTFKDDSIGFGGIYIHSTNQVAEEIYIVKYDVNGVVQWARSAGGTNWDQALAICSDPAGNIYVTGKSNSDSITFNGIGTNHLTMYDAEMFIVKYNSAGDIVWAQQGSGPTSGGGEGYPNAITTDAAGNVFVAGMFTGTTVTFASTWVTNTSTNPSVAGDIFIVKYSTNGVFQWLKQGGSTNYDNCYGASADSSGNVYIAGYFQGAGATFGSTTLANTGFNSESFLLKYDPNGNVIWGLSISGIEDDEVRGVDCNNEGNVVIAGNFLSPTLTIGTATITNSDNSGNSRDYFIVLFDTAGTVQWGTSDGSVGAEIVEGVALGGGGAVYVAGRYHTTFTVGTSSVSSTNANEDVFVAGYTNAGVGHWVKSAGSTGNDYCEAIVADSAGNVRITGYYNSPTITFDQTWSNTNSNYDCFIAGLQATTNVENSLKPATVAAYPNPTSGVVRIVSATELHDGTANVFDCQGRLVYTQNSIVGNAVEIDCSGFAPGVYVLKLSDERAAYVQTLIVE